MLGRLVPSTKRGNWRMGRSKIVCRRHHDGTCLLKPFSLWRLAREMAACIFPEYLRCARVDGATTAGGLPWWLRAIYVTRDIRRERDSPAQSPPTSIRCAFSHLGYGMASGNGITQPTGVLQ